MVTQLTISAWMDPNSINKTWKRMIDFKFKPKYFFTENKENLIQEKNRIDLKDINSIIFILNFVFMGNE